MEREISIVTTFDQTMMHVVVQPVVGDPSYSNYSTETECFYQEVESYPKPQFPKRRIIFFTLVVPVVIIIIVVSVVVSNNKNSAATPSRSASSSSGTGISLSARTPYTQTTTPPPPTTSSGVSGGSPSAPIGGARSYVGFAAPQSPSSTSGSGMAGSPSSPAITPSHIASAVTPSPSASDNSGAYITSGPLYDESVLADHWLHAHNTRREALYAQHNVSRKDLKWSANLAASAQNYSELLLTLPGCTIEHGYLGNHYGGENIAMTWDTGIAVTVLPELVLQAWFDNEANMPYGQNWHWSQVGWRGSGYVGCGIAQKIPSSGFSCFVSTCRYIATGNCNMDESNQLTVMLQDTSPCPPACPAEGCF